MSSENTTAVITNFAMRYEIYVNSILKFAMLVGVYTSGTYFIAVKIIYISGIEYDRYLFLHILY